MLSRSSNVTAGFSERATAMRRQRRRVANTGRIYCATNGCTSFLKVDPSSGTATCQVCGFTRRLS